MRAVVRGCGRSSKEIEDGMHRDAPRLRMVRYLPYDIIGLRALRRCSGLANKRWTRVILNNSLRGGYRGIVSVQAPISIQNLNVSRTTPEKIFYPKDRRR